ncbi:MULTISPECIES: DUF4020 domain-containing protein [unclassified Variovorax]|uniref:DUF4020 domain-containing protein n=1 Tax=unclassified Variovorax TaxID=663243 RepID=UPI002577D65C|nr:MULTISPECIES: DUF4020 domain-containing protein [unclassified Variovorax]MDM0086949.1 DUF4020 domain-containing protein [Variovorax sp. J22G40]MDM0144794.1 DUF4020 domain-containing protein [Variovorax sp. J2P1-31]
MTRLGTLEFDDCILDALRDDNLVVFAGAGVSMGPPSNLASFWKLANDIALGTGLAPTESEPLDRFLGTLQHRKVAVHERAAQSLSPVGSAPNALHWSLLRLFRTAERVRVVTTNFDRHFETAANALFGSEPRVYHAPALPLGYDFTGIVHVHGALPHARDLVLTDADFGRAYLTEGWARRFLLDVFRRYTVLFVGYSHNDVVMNYLARALPAEVAVGRFALTDEDGSWDLLGIKPVRFNRVDGPSAYQELYDGVQMLAERATRGALDWQTRMAEIGGREPPADAEATGEVEHALREVHTTRFFTNVARSAEWPKWLGARKHLDALFSPAELSERDKLLAWWLAEHFAIEHPNVIFDLLATHGMRLNPNFWWSIGRELGVVKDKPLEEPALKRWVSILLATAPTAADHHVMSWLAERCGDQGLFGLTLKVFFSMGQHRLNIKPKFVWHELEDGEQRGIDAECVLRADHWSMNEVWTKHLQPQIASIAQPLLSGISQRLEEMHHDLRAWEIATQDWDSVSYGRAAIEAHEQDRHPEAIDVLIDAARDALEWLAGSTPALANSWIERLIASDVPLLRRLAIHATTVLPQMSADERLGWLLDRVDLNNFLEHHEIRRAAFLSFGTASEEMRQAIVNGVLAHTLPASDDRSAEMRTARAHFDWLSWLLQSKPDCPLAGAALALITAQYPHWVPSDHPDLTHWTGSAEWVGSRSPWSVEELLARTPGEQLDDLLNFNGNRFDGAGRDGLIATVRDACKQESSWAFEFAEALSERLLWPSDLWPAVIRGLQEAELGVDGWRRLLAVASRRELREAHAYDIANLLYALVRDGGKPFALDLLEDANAIALPVWQALPSNAEDEDVDDWLSRAINRPAGAIVEFWISGLSLFMHGKGRTERTLPDNYRQWFTVVAQDATSKGGLGRTLLASQTAFLFSLSDDWTRQHIVPLFNDKVRQKFRQAWDGFLVWGRLNPALVEALMSAFIGALERFNVDFSDRRRRFVEFYAALAVFHVTDPTAHLLPALFKYGSVDDRIGFTSHVGHCLRQLQPAARQELWDAWLHRYWQGRLQAVPVKLEEAEIRAMIEWLPDLSESFPTAVTLVVRSPPVRIEHSGVLYGLKESDLVTRYPAETAQLLIYLCSCVIGYHAGDLGTIAGRLPALEPALRRQLDDGLAQVGVKR